MFWYERRFHCVSHVSMLFYGRSHKSVCTINRTGAYRDMLEPSVSSGQGLDAGEELLLVTCLGDAGLCHLVS